MFNIKQILNPINVAVGNKFNCGIVILTYHNVAVFSDHQLTVKVEDFRNQLDVLLELGEIISFDEAIELIKSNIKIDKLYFVISFDDGYKGIYSNVFPILKRLNVPIIIYLTTNFINNIISAPVSFKLNESHDFVPLKWDDIRIMLNSNLVTLGAHTANHFNCDEITLDILVWDIMQSSKTFAKEVGYIPSSFAYPRGFYDLKTLNEISKYFNNAVTMNYGKINPNGNLFRINRVFISGKISKEEFQDVVTGRHFIKRKFIEYVKHVIRRIKTSPIRTF